MHLNLFKCNLAIDSIPDILIRFRKLRNNIDKYITVIGPGRGLKSGVDYLRARGLYFITGTNHSVPIS